MEIAAALRDGDGRPERVKGAPGAPSLNTASRRPAGPIRNTLRNVIVRALIRLGGCAGGGHSTPHSTRNFAGIHRLNLAFGDFPDCDRAKVISQEENSYCDSQGWVKESGSKVFWQHHDRSFSGCIQSIPLAYACVVRNRVDDLQRGAVGDFLADFLAGRGWAVGKDARGAAGRERRRAPRAGMCMRAWPARRPTWCSPRIWIRFRRTFRSARTRSLCTGAGFRMRRGLSPRRWPRRSAAGAGFKVGMLFVSGEERDSAGAKAANLNPKGSRFLINGEPTDNRLALASKGALRVSLKTTGKMAHSAYPGAGRQRRAQDDRGAGQAAEAEVAGG
jgi:hypothetical protein